MFASGFQALVNITGWTLLHFLWQGAVVWCLCVVAMHLTRSQSANVRYMLCLVSLGALAVFPVVTFFLLATASSVDVSVPVAVLTPAWPAAISSILMPLAVLVWCGGVALRLWRVLRDWRTVSLLTRRGCRPVSLHWQRVVGDICVTLSISRPVVIMESLLVQVPAAVGWLRPVVLIPTSALLGLTTKQLELIIAHELAHIRRFDYLVNLCQVALETVFFFHPLVLAISRRIRIEREVCCDEMVVREIGSRYEYAQALARLENVRATPAGCATMMAANGGQLVARIEHLASDRQPQNHHLVASVLLLGAGLAGVMGAITVMLESRGHPQAGFVAVDEITPPTPPLSPSVTFDVTESIRWADVEPVSARAVPLTDVEAAVEAPKKAALPAEEPGVVSVAPGAARHEVSERPKGLAAVRASTRPAPAPRVKPAPRVAATLRPVPAAAPLPVDVPVRVAPVAAAEPVTTASEATAGLVIVPAVYHKTTASERESDAMTLLRAGGVYSPPVTARSRETTHGIRKLFAQANNEGGELIHRVDPLYPNMARERGMEGSVTVDFAVTETGAVEDIQVVSRGVTPGFRRSVKQAVALWKYSPLRRDGLPVAYRQTRTFTFRLVTPLRVAQGRSCIPNNNNTWACRSLAGTPN